MRNIWHIFVGDLKRITCNVVTAIIVLGLIFLPSLFSWYNVLACWDVFDNTGNLKVAVASVDEGYKSDIVPVEINLGNNVVSELRANDQLDWVFTTEEDAIDGTKSGEYYAAVVIPKSFSKDMMTFYTDDAQSADIVYYTNEKLSAVAPKITDQGADSVSYQVNQIFTQTLSDVALGIASSLSKEVDQADITGNIGVLARHVDMMGTQTEQASTILTSYAGIIDSAKGLVQGSANMLSQTKDVAGQAEGATEQSKQAVGDITSAMQVSADSLKSALTQSRDGYGSVADLLQQTLDSSDGISVDTEQSLRDQAAAAAAKVKDFDTLISDLEKIRDALPADHRTAIEDLLKRMDGARDLQNKLVDSLNAAADSISDGRQDAATEIAHAKDYAYQAQASIDELAAGYETDVRPDLEELAGRIAALTSSLNGSASQLSDVGNTLQGEAGSVSDKLDEAKNKLLASAADMKETSQTLRNLSSAISNALATGDSSELRTLLSSDTDTLASVLASPVELDRHAVFPAENFGSQMAPLYTTLALWIGSLLLVVAVKVVVSEKQRSELDNPRLSQLFLGRFGVFAVLSFAQSTVMGLGNMLFLGVQVSDPLLFMVCFWAAGLVFSFIIYTMVASFANLGKAFAVFLLIVQVTAGGGSFPLQVLPDFFQALSPYLPATHVINAMRAAMMGVYANDFWIEIGYLLLFLIPFALLGLVLRKPLLKFLNWYIEKVEDSKLVA